MDIALFYLLYFSKFIFVFGSWGFIKGRNLISSLRILGFFLNTNVKLVKCFFGLQHRASGRSGKYSVPHCHSCLQLPWQASVIYHGPLSCWACLQLEIILHSVLKAATAELAQEVEIISHPCSRNSVSEKKHGKVEEHSRTIYQTCNAGLNQTYYTSDMLGFESNLCH